MCVQKILFVPVRYLVKLQQEMLALKESEVEKIDIELNLFLSLLEYEPISVNLFSHCYTESKSVGSSLATFLSSHEKLKICHKAQKTPNLKNVSFTECSKI